MDKKKTIIITGSSGFVGKNLYKTLGERHTIVGLDRNESEWTDYTVDLTDEVAVKRIVKETNPDVLIHVAAVANVEWCEANREESFAINVGGTKHLLGAISDNVHFIYISSDYVYDGKKGNFTERDRPNPISWYGQNKLDSEHLVGKHEKHLILRPTVIYGWDPGGKNFFMQVYENQKTGKPMNIPVDQYSNPTYVNLLLEMIEHAIDKPLYGTFIATGPETMHRYTFALLICEVFGFDRSILNPVETKELAQIAKRPLNCGTDSSKIQRALGMKFSSVKESLLALKKIVHEENS